MSEQPDTDSVAARLRALRKEANLTLEGIANRLGMEISTYRHYEERFKGKFLPQHLVLALLDALPANGADRSRILALGAVREPEEGLAAPAEPYRGNARGNRLLQVLSDPPAPGPKKIDQEMKIGTDGHYLSVVATVDREGVDRLIKRLQIMRDMLD